MPDNEILMVPDYINMPADAARLNVTWNGANGFLVDPVPYDASDVDLRAMAQESLRNGDIPGITADQAANLGDFVVDRFPATDDVPYARVFIRPKTPFGR